MRPAQRLRLRTMESHLDEDHRFKVGESVRYTSGPYSRAVADAVYTVTQLLPPQGDERQYRIKSSDEPHERVVKESELNRYS